jgi:hypothetical protein
MYSTGRAVCCSHPQQGARAPATPRLSHRYTRIYAQIPPCKTRHICRENHTGRGVYTHTALPVRFPVRHATHVQRVSYRKGCLCITADVRSPSTSVVMLSSTCGGPPLAVRHTQHTHDPSHSKGCLCLLSGTCGGSPSSLGVGGAWDSGGPNAAPPIISRRPYRRGRAACHKRVSVRHHTACLGSAAIRT